MLLSDQKQDQVQTVFVRLDEADSQQMLDTYRSMVQRADVVADEQSGGVRFEAFFDMRYAGQEFTLPVPVTEQELERGELDAVRDRFDEIHLRRYGHQAPEERAELVNLRVTAVGARVKPSFAGGAPTRLDGPAKTVPVHLDGGGEAIDVPVYPRESLPAGAEITGPALIEEYASTTIIFERDVCRVAATQELVIEVAAEL